MGVGLKILLTTAVVELLVFLVFCFSDKKQEKTGFLPVRDIEHDDSAVTGSDYYDSSEISQTEEGVECPRCGKVNCDGGNVDDHRYR